MSVFGGRFYTVVLHMAIRIPGPVALGTHEVFHLNVWV